ncbi:ABC transporter permease [Pseudoxanthomonas daejeonensis]|uniref:Transport permease protein n=1 Tax=Pseudoxanthomonas daejeonensis TaxID=266062 RepID=A0ABQ6ZAT4_9GAMM|nr:ABC transporter permease [Pseudoxanthomonas daejeonensis]KAF1696955.1 ABC transporter permease [Pseudoxanthomonas daejeonensis]
MKGNFVSRLWTNRKLAWEMAKREVYSRYRGSAVGVAWSFFFPVLMLGVYTFVFGVIFRSKWTVPDGQQSTTEFALILFAGLIVFGMFSECLVKSPALIANNPQFVKKVVFPLEVLPVSCVLAAIFHMLVSLVVLFMAMLFVQGGVPWTALLFPLVVFPLLLATLGVSWFLASTGVYLRDLGQLMPLLSMALLFMSPVFYPITAIPERYRHIVEMNPITGVVDAAREVLVFGRLPDWSVIGWQMLASLVIAVLGLAWFRYVRKGFADVL